MEETAARRKRINRLKKMILGTIAMAILIPIVVCIILGVRIALLSKKVTNLQVQLEEEQKKNKELEEAAVKAVNSSEESDVLPKDTGNQDSEESGDAAEDKNADESGEPEFAKEIYLTFDDGPSSNTNAILDILKAYDVKATFFVTGKTDEASKEAYRRIVAEGHTLGMHSYSHKYDEIYESREAFSRDLKELQDYLYEVTGVQSTYYRFPGGSSNTVSDVDMQEFIACLEENGISYYDWNVASGDAVSVELPVETIIDNCMSGIDIWSECIVLMHDSSSKNTTVEALPELISQIRLTEDACFLPITSDTRPVQHLKAQQEESN